MESLRPYARSVFSAAKPYVVVSTEISGVLFAHFSTVECISWRFGLKGAECPTEYSQSRREIKWYSSCLLRKSSKRSDRKWKCLAWFAIHLFAQSCAKLCCCCCSGCKLGLIKYYYDLSLHVISKLLFTSHDTVAYIFGLPVFIYSVVRFRCNGPVSPKTPCEEMMSRFSDPHLKFNLKLMKRSWIK